MAGPSPARYSNSRLPFPLMGVDSDNKPGFINVWHGSGSRLCYFIDMSSTYVQVPNQSSGCVMFTNRNWTVWPR